MNEHSVPGKGNENIQAEQFEPDLVAEPPHPINWNLLTSQDLEEELLELNRWVNWLRTEYGLPAAVIPPVWHRHPELLWSFPHSTCIGCAPTTPTKTVQRRSDGIATSQRLVTVCATG